MPLPNDTHLGGEILQVTKTRTSHAEKCFWRRGTTTACTEGWRARCAAEKALIKATCAAAAGRECLRAGIAYKAAYMRHVMHNAVVVAVRLTG